MDKQIVVVTGGTSGIGLETVNKFLQKGSQVIGLDLAEDKFADAKKNSADPERLEYMKLDVTEKDAVEKVFHQIEEKYKRIDVLVNCAGIVGKEVDLTAADLSNIEATIKVNLLGTIYTSKFAGQVMKEQGSGTIINVGSIDGVIANHESVGYHASKGGVHMFTKAFAREMGPFGVRVLAVAPGWVETSMVPDNVRDYGKTLMMKHRLIQPQELANAIYLLTLPDASAINGTIVMVDDGYSSFKGMGILKLM